MEELIALQYTVQIELGSNRKIGAKIHVKQLVNQKVNFKHN